MRHLLLIIVAVGLLACNQVSESIGDGPRLVTQSFAEQVAGLDRDLRFRNVSIAIGRDRDNGKAAMHYCPALGDCVNDLDGSVVERCSDSGKYECALFMLDDKIVWRGPVSYLDTSSKQAMPYSGRWSVQYAWQGVATDNLLRKVELRWNRDAGRGL
ncbi:MAG: hypothetical protein P1U65_07105 [Minwuia sp.]|nr:hypothetical protein [Minwuia sp.]